VDFWVSRRIDLAALFFFMRLRAAAGTRKKYRKKSSKFSGPFPLAALIPQYTIAVILLVLWLAGGLGLQILGGFMHILVVLAIIAMVMAMLKKA